MSNTNGQKKKYRDQALEVQACSWLINKPSSVALVQDDWFSFMPLRLAVQAIRKVRVVLTPAALLSAIKSLDDYDSETLPLVKKFIGMIDDSDKLVSEKSFQFVVTQLMEMYALRHIVEELSALDITPDTCYQDLQSKLRELSQPIVFTASDKSGDWVGDFDLRKEELVKKNSTEEGNKKRGIPTGIIPFDQAIGGLMPGEFGVVAGQPGIGKTTCLVEFAARAYLNGFNVLFCSGEMSKYDIQTRFDSHFAGVPSQRYRTGHLDDDEMSRWSKTVEKYKLTQNNFLEVTAFPRLFNVQQIEADIVRVQDKWEAAVDLLLVDYINIMNPNKATRNGNKDWEAQSDVVWDLKGLVADINGGISCWTAGQIKDEAFDTDRLELDHLKYARAISETAPIVVGLIRTVDDELEKRMRFQVLKMRNAQRLERSIFLHPNLELMRLHESFKAKKNLAELDDQVGGIDKAKKRKYGK